MYHKDDTSWKDEDAAEMLQTPFPKIFSRVFVDHYTERIQQVVNSGKKYTPEYFFVRNKLKGYKKQL